MASSIAGAIGRAGFLSFTFSSDFNIYNRVTVENFRGEISEALKSYEKYIVCLDKTPEECEASLVSLMEKAIKAYQNRGPNLRHGIALDKQVTIILSQTETEKPLCGIYFNLSSPYHKRNGGRAGKAD